MRRTTSSLASAETTSRDSESPNPELEVVAQTARRGHRGSNQSLHCHNGYATVRPVIMPLAILQFPFFPDAYLEAKAYPGTEAAWRHGHEMLRNTPLQFHIGPAAVYRGIPEMILPKNTQLLPRGPVFKLFAGGMRSRAALKRHFVLVLATVSGVPVFAVDTDARNGVFFQVQGERNRDIMKMWSRRLRCIGDDVYVSLLADAQDADQQLNDILVPVGVKHGHPAPIEDPKQPSPDASCRAEGFEVAIQARRA